MDKQPLEREQNVKDAQFARSDPFSPERIGWTLKMLSVLEREATGGPSPEQARDMLRDGRPEP